MAVRSQISHAQVPGRLCQPELNQPISKRPAPLVTADRRRCASINMRQTESHDWKLRVTHVKHLAFELGKIKQNLASGSVNAFNTMSRVTNILLAAVDSGATHSTYIAVFPFVEVAKVLQAPGAQRVRSSGSQLKIWRK